MLARSHPEFVNLLLQILDDGRVTDGQGRTVNFRNTIIILTSNVGSQSIIEAGGDVAKQDEVRLKVLDQLRGTYRPEFLNRLGEPHRSPPSPSSSSRSQRTSPYPCPLLFTGELILFQPLQKRQLASIARLTLEGVKARLQARDVSLIVTDAALGVLADLGYSPEWAIDC